MKVVNPQPFTKALQSLMLVINAWLSSGTVYVST